MSVELARARSTESGNKCQIELHIWANVCDAFSERFACAIVVVLLIVYAF